MLSGDGAQLALYPITDSRIMMLALDGKGTARALTALAPFMERNPDISEDGRWIACESDESGTFQINVRPFPSVEQRRWQLSIDGGTRPRWAPNGRELYYVSNNRRLMAVSVHAGAALTSGKPEELFDDVGAQPSPNAPLRRLAGRHAIRDHQGPAVDWRRGARRCRELARGAEGARAGGKIARLDPVSATP